MTRGRRLILAGLSALSLLSSVAASFAQVPAPVPALPDSERRTSYSITASTCTCNVNFAIYGDSNDFQSWIEVWLNGTRLSFNDATFGWTITSPTGPVGNIARPITDAVLTFNLPQTGTVQIVGARRPRRTSQFSENQGVSARNLNQVITDIVAMLREVWDKINDVTGRSLIGVPGDVFGTLPPASVRAGQFLCFSSNGQQPLTCPPISGGSLQAGSGIALSGTNPTVISLAAGGINSQTGNYPIQPSDCELVIAASGGFNTLTLPGPGAVPTGCEITVKNSETYTGIGTAHGKKLIGFPSDVNSILWPLQTVKVKSNGAAWLTTYNPGRWIIPTSAEICVSQNGSDANDGLAAGTGCLQTPQQAAVVIGEQWDGGGFNSCSIGFYAGGTNVLGGANQTGQSVGCFITINIRGAITWASTGACWTGGDNSITILNWNLGFMPTFKCNSANMASEGQLKCHQYCVFDINGGTAIWLPSGPNDVFFDLDLQGSATYNATVNVGDGVNTFVPLAFIACEAHCSKVTVSGSLAFSPFVTMGVVYVLRSGSVITTGITFPGVTATNPSTPTGNSILITNGTTIPGGTSSQTGGQVCTTAC
jgi:hypothetical protein